MLKKLDYKKLSHAARLASVATIAILIHRPAVAAPQGEVIAAGEVSVHRSENSLTTTVNQISDRAVIQWESFNLAENEQVDFILPTVTSATLNQINDPSPSTISGTITSNGILYFVNPNGLVFDATSRVTANGFTAFTGAIDPADFMNRPLSQIDLGQRGGGEISLNGTLTVPTLVGFDRAAMMEAVADSVMVGGSLSVEQGTIAIDSASLTHLAKSAVISVGIANNGEGGTISLSSDNQVTIMDSDPESQASLSSNRGTISLTAPTVTVGGNITATRGNIKLSSTTSTNLTETAKLNASRDEWGAMGVIELHSDGAIAAFGQTTVTSGRLSLSGNQITVGGSLTAVNASISLVSVSATEITAQAIITADRLADAGGIGNVNQITIASGGSVTLAGTVSALGNRQNPEGGRVIISARSGLNLTGTVTTRAEGGIAGSLTLAAPMIEIGSGDIEGITYHSARRVSDLAANHNLILDTTLVDLTGLDDPLSRLGSILVSEATTVPKNLTLRASKIIVYAAITAGNSLTLHQLGNSDSDGIAISEAALNAGGNLSLLQNGTVADGKSGILLLGNGVSLSSGGGSHRITLQTRSPSALQLIDGEHFTLSGGRLRLELAGGTITSNGGSLKADGFEVIYNGALSGNQATLAIGSGSLIQMIDHHNQTAPLILGDGLDSSAVLNSDAMEFTLAARDDSGVQAFERGGLTVTSRNGSESVNRLGLYYGGTVEIKGVVKSAAKNLYAIEAAGIAVTAPSGFDHSLILQANGSGIAVGDLKSGILITADLLIGSLQNRDSSLSLRQSGIVSGDGIVINSVNLLIGGSLKVEQTQSLEGVGFKLNNTGLTIGKDFTLDQGASFGADGVRISSSRVIMVGSLRFNLQFDHQDQFRVGGLGLLIKNSDFNLGGSMEIFRRGADGDIGIYLNRSNFKTDRSVIISQEGNSQTDGIFMGEVAIRSGADLTIIQKGRVGDGYSGIRFAAIPTTQDQPSVGVKLYGGRESSNWITISSRAATGLTLSNSNNFFMFDARVRIDLGSGTMVSDIPRPITVNSPTNYDLWAYGLSVYYTGATSGNNARLFLGGGSFTYVTDHRDRAETTILDNNVSGGNAAIGWDQGLVFTTSIASSSEYATYVNSSGLKIHSNSGLSGISGNGVVYGGLVELTGLNAASAAGNLSYIEGAAIKVSGNASNFKSSVTLISNGNWAGAVNASTGIAVTANLSVQNDSSLSLIQRGRVEGDGITITGVTLNRSNLIYILQSGVVSGKGIMVDDSTITIDNYLWLLQTGSAATGIMVSNSSLFSKSSVSVDSFGSLKDVGITVQSSELRSEGSIDVELYGDSGGAGLVLNDSSLIAEGNISLVQNGQTGPSAHGIEWLASGEKAEGQIGKGFGVLLQSGLAKDNKTITIRSNGSSALGLGGHDNFILRNGAVMLDLGHGRIESFNSDSAPFLSIEARNLEVKLIAANSGNSAGLIIDRGQFTKIYNFSTYTTTLVIDDQSTIDSLGGPVPGWDNSEDGTLHRLGGLTIETQRGGTWQGFGLIYGGFVMINGVNRGIASNLSLIQANGISVKKASHFNHHLSLISTGTSNRNYAVGIEIGADLSTGTRGDGNSFLTLVAKAGDGGKIGIAIQKSKLVIGGNLTISQIQDTTDSGIHIDNSTLESGGNITLEGSGEADGIGVDLYKNSISAAGSLAIRVNSIQYSNGISLGSNSITVGGDILLTKSFYTRYNAIAIANGEFRAGGNIILTSKGSTGFDGIYSENSSFTAKGDIDFEVAGDSERFAIWVTSTRFKSGRELSLRQEASADSSYGGILIENSQLQADSAINVMQLGTVAENEAGIALVASTKSGGYGEISFKGLDRNLSWVTLKSTAKLSVGLYGSPTANLFSFFDAKVRIDLGGIWASGANLGAIGRVNAKGLDLFYNSQFDIILNGRQYENSVQFDIGDGSFTNVMDFRHDNRHQILTANNLIRDGFDYPGVRVIFTANNPRASNIGLAISGDVTIISFPLGSSEHPITFIEGGTITVTSVNGRTRDQLNLMTRGGKITLQGSINFTKSLSIFTRGGDLELTGTMSTDGGLVAINLGKGVLNNQPAASVNQWQIGTATSRNPLYLYASGLRGDLVDGALAFSQVLRLNLYGGVAASGTSTSDTSLARVGFYSDNREARHYFTSLGYSTDQASDFAKAQVELTGLDVNGILHPMGDSVIAPNLVTTVTAGLSLDEVSGNLVWKTERVFAPSGSTVLPNRLGFFAVRGPVAPEIEFAADSSIVFAGANRLTHELDWSGRQNIVAVTLLDGSSITGSLVLPNRGVSSLRLTVGQDVTLPSMISSGTILLRLEGNLLQSKGSLFSANIILDNQRSYSLRLTNRYNRIGLLSGVTMGGAVVVNSEESIDLSGLNTGGASVTVRSEGSIFGDELKTGMIGFTAKGEVFLKGRFAGASGRAQSVSLTNSSAGAVVGNVTADGAIELGGSGTTILVGNLSSQGGGAIEVNQAITVAAPAVLAAPAAPILVSSHEGVIALSSSLTAMNSATAQGLILWVGDHGRIDLGPNRAAILSLGWVSLNPDTRLGVR